MKLLEKMKSQLDNTVKYVIQLDDGLISEVSFIDKNDGKSIYCMPSTTGCGMRCSFCHAKEFSVKTVNRDLTDGEIFEMYRIASNDVGYAHETLLISYMGMGDPFTNIKNVIRSMSRIKAVGIEDSRVVRFALCSMFPRTTFSEAFDKLVEAVYLNLLDVKLHASIHALGESRKGLMPMTIPESGILDMLDCYMSTTEMKSEIHYALIDGVNDSQKDIDNLYLEIIKYIRPERYSQFTVKFLQYNESSECGYKRCKDQSAILKYAKSIMPVTCELYSPPGQDIGASCGQFNSKFYLKYNSKVRNGT